MPKNIRRATVTRTVTFTATIDLPGYPEETDANLLVVAGGAAGTTGLLSIAELLSGSAAANGAISRGNWSVTGTSVNVESYISRPQNTALTVGRRVASVTPPAGYEAAISKMFVVTTAGTTANSGTEPNWSLTDGGTTTDGTVTYTTIPKFPTINTFATSTAYALGQIVKPSSTSTKEFLVTTAGTSGASAPTWTSADTLGATVTSGTVTFRCITNTATVADYTPYALGDILKPSSASSQEYLVIAAGTTGAGTSTGLTAGAVGNTVTLGSVIFKRMV